MANGRGRCFAGLKSWLAGCLPVLMLFSGCGWQQAERQEVEKVVVYSSHPLSLINPLAEEFEKETGVQVEVHAAGTGQLLARLEEGEHGDVFWGGTLSSLEERWELFAEYRSANEDAMQEDFHNVEGRFTRFSDMPSVLLVNTNLLGDIKVEGYGDLLNTALRGRIAFADPEKSSSSYEHLANMLWAMGDGDTEAGWEYVAKFYRNLGGRLLDSSREVYEGVARGEYALGCTFEEAGAGLLAAGAPVQVIYMREGVIFRPDVICLLQGAEHGENARRFIDFITGQGAQAYVAGKLHRRSVRRDVALPPGLPSKEEIRSVRETPSGEGDRRQARLDRFKSLSRK